MPIVYILTLLLITAVAPQCTPALYSRNITTQMLSFSAANIQNGAYTFTFPSAFSSPPQTALSITQITTTSPLALSNSSFYITASPTTRAVRIMLAAVGSNWLVSRVCLWASTNSQLLLGSALMPNSKSTSGSLPSFQFQIQISSSLPVNNNQIARGFLNGLSCRGMLGSVTVASLVYTVGKITVNVNVEGDQVDALWISFVVFNLNNGQFAAYGGYITMNSNDSQTTDLMKGFSDPQNAIYGINALRADQNRNGMSLQMDMDSSFLLSYTSKMGSFVASYIFIGYPANFTCLPCKGLMQNYYFNGNCLSQCSPDTIAVTLSNGGQLCRGCPGGMIVVNGNCVCPDGYAIQDGKCLLIVINPTSLQGINVQYSNNQGNIGQPVSGTDQGSNANSQSGSINIIPSQNINQNLNFISNSQNNPANTVTMTSTSSSTASTNSFVFLPTSAQGSQQSMPSAQSTTTNTQAMQASSNMNVIYKIASSSCQIPNAFFNGYECVCFVGYVYSNGKCSLPQITNPIIVPTPIFVSPNITQCPANSYFNGSACVCVANYYLVNNICTLRAVCPPNSLDNGLGTCICNNGFTMVNNVCQTSSSISITTCPPNSTLIGGACVCNSGLYNISGSCSPCPSQAYWSSQAQKCLYVCGVNAAYNQSLGGCACVTGFGRDSSGNCALCTANFYVSNGYCVTCPANSLYNATSKQCLCMTGFLLTQQGICMQKCGSNEVYNPLTTFCECVRNFTRIGTTCMPCPFGSFFSNGNCTTCPANSQLLGNKCICSVGYAADGFGVCQPCSALPNAFMLNGLCVKCSNNMMFNVTSNTCECPLGKTRSGTLCISACNNDQLLDRYGNCYTCGMNEVISNGACACQSGYSRNSCGMCTLSCSANSFLFMGRCATCPLNMNYLPAIGGCVCPNGYYMDPISNTCAPTNFVMPNCQSGTYYDYNAQKCQTCSANCAACSSNNTCSSCSRGFNLNNGICVTICGDGVVSGSETCDTGANPQPGCISCRVVQGYSCLGQPSVCSLIQTPPINNTTPNITTPSAPRLSLKGNISLNSNNIFLSLLTSPTFTFPNPTIMQNFIQATYVNTLRPVTYCVQQASNLNTFDCLLIYSSGIPNTKFNVLFSYNYQGQAANVTVTIDPLLYASSARTVSPGSTTRSQ